MLDCQFHETKTVPTTVAVLSPGDRTLLLQGLNHLQDNDFHATITVWQRFVETTSHCALAQTVRTYLTLLTREEARRHAYQLAHKERDFVKASDLTTIAVLNFKNPIQEKPYHKALMHMIITDLAHITHLNLIERARIQTVLDELQLSAAHLTVNSLNLGRLLGASHIISGAILFDRTTGEIQISSFIGDTKTQSLIAEQEARGKRIKFFTLQKEIVFEILLEMGIEEKDMPAELHKIHTEHWQAFEQFSSGLHFLDEGQYAKARDALKQALAMDSEFQMARDMLAGIPEREFSLAEIKQHIHEILH